jgi:Macrocin-O-methyltransferase (TylF)
MSEHAPDDPRPMAWPYRADPPQRYWGNYRVYIQRGGLVRLEDDIRGFVAGQERTGDVSRFYFFCVAFDEMMKEGIKGDLAELGVYRGNTATLIAMMARRMGTTAYLLDTFEGFNSADLKGVDARRAMEFTDTSLEAVRALVGEDGVRYVKGYFPESMSQVPDDLKFALVHIDCDLYTPIANALNYFYPRLVPGGYLIVHDYFSLAWDGAEKAVDEFFADKPEPVIPLTDGCGSAVIRKARVPGRDGNWMTQKKHALFSSAWTSAGGGGLRPLLGDGWSVDEAWGVWGIGASHTIDVYMDTSPFGDIQIDVEAGAALIGPRQSQSVDVVVNGAIMATWQFSKGQNYGVRSVRIPNTAVTTGAPGCPTIRLMFRPHDVRPIDSLDPGNKDTRPLGMALKAIRNATGG